MSFYLGLSINLSKTVSLDHFMTQLLPSSGAIYLGSLRVPSSHTHAHLLHRVLVGTLATLIAFANFQYYTKSKGKDRGRGGWGVGVCFPILHSGLKISIKAQRKDGLLVSHRCRLSLSFSNIFSPTSYVYFLSPFYSFYSLFLTFDAAE